MVVERTWCVKHRVSMAQPLNAKAPIVEIVIYVELETINDSGVGEHRGGRRERRRPFGDSPSS